MNNIFSKFFVFFIFLQAQIFCDVTYSSNSSLTDDKRLQLSDVAIFTTTLTLDGAGFSFILPFTNDQVLIVQNSAIVTLTNILLQNFSPSHVSLGSGSSLTFGSGTYISLLKNESLNSTLKLAGTCVLDGGSKMISLGSSGVIEAQSGGSVTLRDLIIYDVNATNLRCADNTASINFDNVKIINRNVWNFATGAFAVTNNLSMLGGGTFVYQSAYASTINDNSTLFLTDGMTFSYDPAKGVSQAVAGQQNLVFTNTSSKLWLDGVTLKVTNTGMRITKCSMQFDRNCSIYSDAKLTDTLHALILGDTTINNDPAIIFGPDAKINLESGVIEYDVREKINLKFGDSVLLRHKTFGLYIERDPALNVGGFASTVYGSTTPSSNSHLYVGAGNSSQTWGSGLLETEVLTGSSYVKFVLASPYVSLSFFPYITAGAVNVVSTPTPPYYAILAHAAYDSYDYNPIRIYKKGGLVGQNIFEGDEVYIMTYYAGFARYLGSNNITYSGPFKEIFQYASVTQPANLDSQLTWIVEAINEKAYLSIPTNYSGTAPNVSGWPSAATFQF